MDIPLDPKKRIERASEKFLAHAFTVIMNDERLKETCDTIFRDKDSHLAARLVFNSQEQVQAYVDSDRDVSQFAQHLTYKANRDLSAEVKSLFDALEQTFGSKPKAILVFVPKPRRTAPAEAPAPPTAPASLAPGNEHAWGNLSRNDKRFLRALRITAEADE